MSMFDIKIPAAILYFKLIGFSFGGFPSHYYKEKYPNVGSKEVANEVLRLLKEAKIPAEGVKRGLDHGVWASFKCGM